MRTPILGFAPRWDVACSLGLLMGLCLSGAALGDWIKPVETVNHAFGSEGPDGVPGTPDDLVSGGFGFSSGYRDGAYTDPSTGQHGAKVIMLSIAEPDQGGLWRYRWTIVNLGTGPFVEYSDDSGGTGPRFLQSPPLPPLGGFEADSRVAPGPPATAHWTGAWNATTQAPGGALLYRPPAATPTSSTSTTSSSVPAMSSTSLRATSTTALTISTTTSSTSSTTIGTTPTSAGTATTSTTTRTRSCGDPNEDERLTATDALIVLRASVGSSACAACVCDVDGSGTVTTTDALIVLRLAVGLPGPRSCPVSCV